jgi:RNA polymerase sigma-70 factor (ECF subfamily)
MNGEREAAGRWGSMESLTDLVKQARAGDLAAYAELVRVTQDMVYAVSCRVLRDPTLAQDATQDTYLRVYRVLGTLHEPEAFMGWLRRIAITVAINLRRGRRATLLRLDDEIDAPVLDEHEARWSELQRQRLAEALLKLSSHDRQLCDRRYHGAWSIARLARTAGVDEQAMRKRLQRIREKLRREIEMAEQNEIRPAPGQSVLPAKIVELLARPRLIDLPENPVGKISDLLRAMYAGFTEVDLPEIVDLTAAEAVKDAIYVEPRELHHLDDGRILRYDLTLPLLLTVRHEGRPLRLWAAGKAYRHCEADATHLEAFQAELLWMDERERVDLWQMAGQILQSVNMLLPGCAVRIMPTEYAMCSQAWELEAECDGRSLEVLAWGIYTDTIVRHLGGDPARHVAIGVGYGLDRLASLRYAIDDVRKIELAKVS